MEESFTVQKLREGQSGQFWRGDGTWVEWAAPQSGPITGYTIESFASGITDTKLSSVNSIASKLGSIRI